jgi:3-polyprenyl-4-hydroxybenzoate decarboxylase
MAKRRAVKAVLTIRMDANTDSVFVDGVEYDRSKMDKNQKRLMRRVIIDALFPKGRR